jgi:hypothetical protein
VALLSFTPQTPVEHRIQLAQAGELSGDALLREIAAAPLYIPSTDEVQEDGSRFQPILLDVDGQAFVAVYTALQRARQDPAPHLLQALGSHFFRRLPRGYGVVVNPGYATQMFVPAHGIAALQQDLRESR